MNTARIKKIITTLNTGGVVVMLTDTLYGILGSALNENTVERIYQIKKRSPEKPYIILIHSLADLLLFGVTVSPRLSEVLSKVWPGPVSVVLTMRSKKVAYLRPVKHTLAFRMPKEKSLRAVLKETGPLVAPSANPEGLTPAHTIKEAKKYFADAIDIYVAGGVQPKKKPSALIQMKGKKVLMLRDGILPKNL